jgi:hypothetical protein
MRSARMEGLPCYDAEDVDTLAQALFHEALHTCLGSDPGDSLLHQYVSDNFPVSSDAKGITDNCWKQK